MIGVNKAFCREPDSPEPPRCPRCGGVGVQVTPETLAAHTGPDESLAEPAFFCGTETCEVAYFDLLERSIPASQARGLFWPKDPAAPLCACHGLSPDDVDAAVESGDLARLREVVRSATAADARCGTLAADGRPCAARVQRLFVRRRQELGG